MPECAWHPGVETNVSCRDCGRVVAAPVAHFVPFLFLGPILFGGVVGEATRRGGGGHRTWHLATIAAVCAVAGALSVGLYWPYRLLSLLPLVGPAVAALYVTSASLFSRA